MLARAAAACGAVRYHHYLQHNLPFKPICLRVRAGAGGAGASLHTAVAAVVATLALPLHKMSDSLHECLASAHAAPARQILNTMAV